MVLIRQKQLLGTWIIIAGLLITSCQTEEVPNTNDAVDLINESYGLDPQQTMDVFLPQGRSQSSTPLIIYIHGGAWVQGSKEEFNEYKKDFSDAFPGYAFISLNYRLYNSNTSANKFPAQEEDVIKSIKYILSKTQEWNISSSIILSGASAGGHLALLHTYKHQSIGNIQGVMALFPPSDLSTLFGANVITTLGLTQLLAGTPSQNPEAYSRSSPITYVMEYSKPTIIFHGTEDELVPISQSELLSKVLDSSGVSNQFTIVQGQGHGFSQETYKELLQEAAAFLEDSKKLDLSTILKN